MCFLCPWDVARPQGGRERGERGLFGVTHSRRALSGSARHLLSSRVLCSTFSERTFTFSTVPRGRRGVMRLTAAVLRKRLARPRVGELSQLGRGKGRAPPMARACMGRCRGERGSEANLPLQDKGLHRTLLMHRLGGLDREGSCLHLSQGASCVRRSLPTWTEAGPVSYPCLQDKGKAQPGASACPCCHTWATVGAGSSSSSKSSMVAAWSSRGSITILALEARSSERHGRMGGLGQWQKRDHRRNCSER